MYIKNEPYKDVAFDYIRGALGVLWVLLVFVELIVIIPAIIFTVQSIYRCLRTGIWEHPTVFSAAQKYLGLDFGGDWVGVQNMLEAIPFWGLPLI